MGFVGRKANSACWFLVFMLTSGLISGVELKRRIEACCASLSRIQLISAYFRLSAVNWLSTYYSGEVKVLIRLQVSDLLGGATDLEAIKVGLRFGWKIYFDESLHSKIYLLDEDMVYVGSANFTSSGLGLGDFYNKETMVGFAPTRADLSYISAQFEGAVAIDEELISKIESYIQEYSDLGSSRVPPTKWPEYIFPEVGILKVTDFPLAQPGDSCSEYFTQPELDFAVISMWCHSSAERRALLSRSKAIKWLRNVLKEQPQQRAWFGFLTERLHNDLADDPSPYRVLVKELLANLLAYCELYLHDEIDVSRPNRSQLVSLVKTDS